MVDSRQLVAVIDDDDGARKALGRVLRAGGFDAIMFSSAEDYLEASTGLDPVCLVVDVHLSGISGFELKRQLSHAGSPLPVVFITALDDTAHRNEAERLGCAAFLAKPFSGRGLLDVLQSLPERP